MYKTHLPGYNPTLNTLTVRTCVAMFGLVIVDTKKVVTDDIVRRMSWDHHE